MTLPKVGKIYTARFIYENLQLQDEPIFTISYREKTGVIQTNISMEDISGIEEFMNSTWKYVHTTPEWVSIFHYEGEIEFLLGILDMEPMIDCFSGKVKDNEWWVTFKKFPHKQEVLSLN